MHEVLRQWHRCVHASISNAGDVSPGLDYSYTQIPKLRSRFLIAVHSHTYSAACEIPVCSACNYHVKSHVYMCIDHVYVCRFSVYVNWYSVVMETHVIKPG